MLDSFVPWPPQVAQRWRDAGHWAGRPVANIVRDAAARWPAQVALIEGERQLTYAQLAATVDHLALALRRLGLQPLQRVVMQLPNALEFVVAYLALSRLGVIPVMALRGHRYSEIRHFVDAAQAVAYLVPGDTPGQTPGQTRGFDFRALAEEIRRDCPTLRHVLVLGEPLPGQLDLRALIGAPAQGAEGPAGAADDAAVQAALAGVRVDPSDVALMLLSGGTTSMSKLIPRTHDDYVLNARLCAQAAGFDEHTVLLALLPLGHNYNLASPGMLGAFTFGGTLVIGGGMQAEQVFPLIERHRVSVVAAAVPLIAQWLASDVPARCDLRSLRVVQNGGARLAPELRARIRSQWGAFPQEIYGTAEGLINMTRLDDPEAVVLESSGSPVCADDEIKVVDDEGREVPDGQPGELLARGPYTIRGYYDAPQKNREAFTDDGFYRMGDLVRKWGRQIHAEGRKKDLINRGGEKISCEEVENLIFKHPKVHQVALVAMPDPVFGEKACAFVVPRPGEVLAFDELIDFLKAQRIATFKLPERLELVEQFPTSLVGKVLKRQLRDLVIERMQAEHQAEQGAGRQA